MWPVHHLFFKSWKGQHTYQERHRAKPVQDCRCTRLTCEAMVLKRLTMTVVGVVSSPSQVKYFQSCSDFTALLLKTKHRSGIFHSDKDAGADHPTHTHTSTHRYHHHHTPSIKIYQVHKVFNSSTCKCTQSIKKTEAGLKIMNKTDYDNKCWVLPLGDSCCSMKYLR